MSKAHTSDNLSFNRNKIYKISDPIQLSEVFFPHKDAGMMRACFLAIINEISMTHGKGILSFDYLPDKYDLSMPSICKARGRMTRLGLIRKTRMGYWILSLDTFRSTFDALIARLEGYSETTKSKEEQDRKELFITLAKATGVNKKG